MSQFFASGGQSIGVSASKSVLPMNIQDWSPLGWTGWISLQSKGFSRIVSNTTVQKHPILWHSAFFIVQLSHPCMTTGKTIALTRQTFVGKVVSLLFNMLSRLVITFLPRSKHLMRHHEFLYKEVIPLCTPGSKVWCPCFTSLLLFETVSLYFLSTWWIWNDAGNLTQILVTNTVGILIEI